MSANPFLKEIARILIDPLSYDLAATTVVFPNKRARLYLSKYLGELTDKPLWAPQYLTITELMEEISGYLFVDRLYLLFETYRIYSEISRTSESFDSFYPYIDTLLADFDEIDKYLVNADDLFQNLADLKSLDGKFSYLTDEQIAVIRKFWDTFNPDGKTKGQETFIALWEAIPKVYHQLKNTLHQKQMAYEGMAYRRAVEVLEEKDIPQIISGKKFVFIGFNALNVCEERLFRYLKNLGCAEFFWDYDTWYTNSDIHEAGYFMRRNIRNFPQVKQTGNENIINNDYSHVLIVPVASNSGQTGILPEIFDRFGIKDQRDVENTAVVLADENLLLSTLYAIPDYVRDINVTMGYPLAGSAVVNLIDLIYELNRNSRRNKEGKVSWYFRDVLAVMENSLMRKHYAETAEAVRQHVLKKKVFFSSEEIVVNREQDTLIFADYFQDEPCKLLMEVITGIIRQMPLSSEEKNTNDPVQTEVLFQVYTFLTRLDEILSTKDFKPGNEVLFRLIRKMLRTMHIPFTGEPLAGLQVLGILETRTIDFSNIILLSANEKILPRPADIPSFIPYNLRKGFGMPTPELQDAIYAYYFYRMIQRAKNIALIYDSSAGDMRTGERSRFLHQLVYESRLPVKEMNVASFVDRIPVKPILIEKDNDIRQALEVYLRADGKSLSPSSINEFLNCPLRFCFHHIMGLPEPEEIAEDIDARDFGSILHACLEHIYSGFPQKVITKDMLEGVLKHEEILFSALDKAFDKVVFGVESGESGRKPEGFNFIVKQVIYSYVKQFLAAESRTCPFTLISLEQKYYAEIPVTINGTSHSLRVGGIIDRIDQCMGKIRILDYKTGKVMNSFKSVESLFDSGEKIRNDAAFQVLLYACVYGKLNPGADMEPGLFFIRQAHAPDFSHAISLGSKKEKLTSYSMVGPEFENLLQMSLSGLFDFSEPFKQTENLRNCMYCPYAPVCRRESGNS
ncbi:MAG: PD-(D/E)XK nuclease family protein [Bacteroidales bacterium]|nr:PD-(D/E)XK nuclease family protein [Bacteroidales bacterium]